MNRPCRLLLMLGTTLILWLSLVLFLGSAVPGVDDVHAHPVAPVRALSSGQTAPLTLTVIGPLTVTQQHPAWLTATVAPPTTTLPITYVWEATTLPSQTVVISEVAHAIALTWDVTGTQHVTVTASNGLSAPLQSTHTVTVEPSPSPQPPLALTMTGPLTAVQRSATWFTATVAPLTTTLPLTYVWEATPQYSQIHTNVQSIQDTVSFTWSLIGTQHVTVTASNGLSAPLQSTYTVTVEEAPPSFVYLPLVRNGNARPAACEPIPGQTYAKISVLENSEPPCPSAEEDAGFNVNLLDFQPRPTYRVWADSPGMDPAAPQFAYVYADPHRPEISEAYQLYYNGSEAISPQVPVPVSAVGLPTAPGQVIHAPDRFGGNVVIDAQGYKALVLYASEQSIALKYTREDGLWGYTVYLNGICVEPDLQALYDQTNAAGRWELPAVFGHQPVGRAWNEEIRVVIRDNGTLLDPRWLNDWWIYP